MKNYEIEITRKNQVRVVVGTVEELTKYFSYNLEVAYSHGQRINRNPKNIKSLMSNLHKAFDFNEGCCYERTGLRLISILP